MTIRPRRMRIVETQRPGIDGDITQAEAAQLRYDTSVAVAGTGALASAVETLEAVNAGLQSQIAGLAASIGDIPSQPVPLPPFSGRYLHMDAQAIVANDGDRLSVWTDLVTGTGRMVQATAANQPAYRASAINGRPAVWFDSARNDNLRAAPMAPESTAATIFMVTTPPASPAANRYLFGTAGGTAKNIYYSSSNNIGLQGVSVFAAPTVPATPQVITAVFGASGGATIRINGVASSGDTGVPTGPPTAFTLGHRASLAAGAGFTGPIGEVIYYNRTLNSDECAAVERYLAARWGIATYAQTTWYVDSVYGDDQNDGRRAGSAVRSFARALDGVRAAKATDATIAINAPASNPIREPDGLLMNMGGTIRLQSAIPGQKWHLYGSQRFAGGWTHVGSGVYSRPLAINVENRPVALVTTLFAADGQPVRIWTRNTTTPTAPNEGEFGYTGGTYYLRLPGGANPNSHAIEIASAFTLLNINSGTTVYGRDAVLFGAQNGLVNANGTATFAPGEVAFTESDAFFSGGSGFGTSGDHVGMTLTRCRAWYCSNDGFNHHGSAGNHAPMELIDCEGAFNGDEGASPHEDTVLIVRRGRFHHNGSGGITSVGSATTYLFGAEVDHNRTIYSGSGWDVGGVSILEQSTLISLDLYSHDNPGPGVEVETAAGASWTDNGGTRSGTEHGNGAPDMT